MPKNTEIGINEAFSVKILDNDWRQNFNQTEAFCLTTLRGGVEFHKQEN